MKEMKKNRLEKYVDVNALGYFCTIMHYIDLFDQKINKLFEK